MLMPQHRCLRCGRLVSGECAHCRRARAKAVDRQRPNAASRGYCSARWKRFRAAQLLLEPLCRLCKAKGVVAIATEVDHIIPIDGPDDPRFLDYAAVQSLCHACHSRKTAIEDSGFVRRAVR
jgi:5-methylcytosine-specific restriction protein A